MWDFISNFPNYDAFDALALGAFALKNGEIVSGASSYSAYLGGIEVENSNLLVNGSIAMDREQKIVTVDGENVRLTPTEFKIMQLFMENPGVVFSSAQIYERVWDEDAYSTENIVSVHIRRIREKVEIDPKNPDYIKVMWGVGYRMEKKS